MHYDMTLQTHLLAGPLESSHNTVLDLIEVLHSLGDVHQQVGPGTIWAEAPDLPGLRHIPLIRSEEHTSELQSR